METFSIRYRPVLHRPMTSKRERRRVQRIRFRDPLGGSISNGALSIVDLSVTGARAVHNFPLKSGRSVRLDFLLRGERLSLTCNVVRCRLERSESAGTTYFSGLQFVNDAELGPLRRLLTEIVGRDLEERRRQRRTSSGEEGIVI
jgi:hypothetical protein